MFPGPIRNVKKTFFKTGSHSLVFLSVGVFLFILFLFNLSMAFKTTEPKGVLVVQQKAQTSEGSKQGSSRSSLGGIDLSKEEADRRLLIEKFKNLDPAMAIYLDSQGQMAGTGNPTDFIGEAERAGMATHPIALEAADLPTDRYGLVDWVEGSRMGKINPRDSLDPNIPPTEPLDLDVVIETKSRFQPRVVFSHKVHTFWLSCDNCHPSIFKQEAGGNPEMTMPKIASGEFCGRCHNRVSFPLTDCLRCHTKPKEETTAGPGLEATTPLR
ncbi:MAG TPA: c(7)-type cytochrome triheme domain-containing protein [Nitrospiria bacterium]